jgi:hypothetical protein
MALRHSDFIDRIGWQLALPWALPKGLNCTVTFRGWPDSSLSAALCSATSCNISN